MAAHDLQNIIDQIVIVQKTISEPANEKAIAAFYDEIPAQVTTFPAFINVEESAEQDMWNPGGRRIDYVIAMHLLLAQSSQKYSVRSRRAWTRPVLDAFGAKVTLSGATGVAEARIQGIDFDLDFQFQPESHTYIAATFRLGVTVKEAFAWAV